MANFDGYPAGTMCWTDLGTSDIEGAKAFYGQLFGWTAEADPNPEYGGYTNMKLNGKRVAAISPVMSEDQPVVWSTYIAVDDADKTTEVARQAGGTVIVEPMDVGEYGRFAFFVDPSGAAVGIWQAGEHKGAEVANEAGTWGWSELNCRNVEAAQKFYNAVFGWSAERSEESTMPYWQWQIGDRLIGGLMEMPPQVPAEVPSYWLTYFSVDDLDASVDLLTSLGGTVMLPRTEIAIGWFAVASDPQGASFALFQPKPH